MPKENDNKSASINVNIVGKAKNAKKGADVLDLSAVMKPAPSKKVKKAKKIKRKIKKEQPKPKVQSFPKDVSIGLVNREKKYIFITGVTFFMAVIVVLWAFNLDQIYSAGNAEAEPLINIEELKNLDVQLEERMAEVKKGLDALSAENEAREILSEEAELSADNANSSSTPVFSEGSENNSSTTKEFKAINLKKIIEDIKNNATGTEEVVE